jgi:hypothetical protein
MNLLQKILCLSATVLTLTSASGQSLKITKKRNPVLDVSSYKQIAVGDIVGVNGIKNETSLDLTDALTSVLFNAKGLEVFDQNALRQILSSQKGSDLKVINESATQILSKNMGAALLLVGRQQTITYKVNSKDPSNPVCEFSVPVQVKLYEVKTGRMIHSDAVTMVFTTKSAFDCEHATQQSEKAFLKQTAKSMAEEISHLVIPYTEEHYYDFEMPMLSMLKNPFKKIDNAISYLYAGQKDKGLEVLKAYVNDPSFKANQRGMTHFNYGLGLYYCGNYEEAKSQFQLASSFLTKGERSNLMQELMQKEIDMAKKDMAKN